MVAAVATTGYLVASMGGSNAGSVRIAYDGMSRTVRNGLGSADVGGAYGLRSTSSRFKASVADHAARLSGLRTGTFAEAWLPSAKARDVESRLVFSLPKLPQSGTGVYVALDLRRAANGDVYRARVRVAPKGESFLGFTRVRKNREVNLGHQVRLPFRLRPGIAMILDGTAVGTKPVRLAARLWELGTSRPGWQHAVADSSSARIASSGATGFWYYLSRKANVAPVFIGQSFDAYALQDVKGLPSASVIPTAVPSGPALSSASHPSSTSAGAQPSGSKSHSASASASASKSSSASSGGGSASSGSSQPPVSAKPNYSVPANALFVAPSGSDGAHGSRSAPFRTLAHAIASARSGSTIVLRGGSYHESVTVPSNKALTIEGYPGENVWFDGTRSVTSWARSGNVWVHTGWNAAFDASPSFSRGGNSGMVNSRYPMASHPDQVWVGGKELDQVGSANQVGAGKFYVDYRNHRLYIGSSPSPGVRASDLQGAIQVNSAGSMLRGFGVRAYATPVSGLGSVILDGDRDVIQYVQIVDSASIGLAMTGKNITAIGVTVLRNGLMGALANYADGLRVVGMDSEYNNDQHFNTIPAAGGFKITRTRGIEVRDSRFAHNYASGLWVDESCYDVKIIGNQLIDNAKHGYISEISAVEMLANNVARGNASDGFKINDITNVKIWNNTLSGNGMDIQLVQDNRRASNRGYPGHDPRRPNPDPTVPWLLKNVAVYNNSISNTHGIELFARDASGQRSASTMGITVNGNTFNSTSGVTIALWGITASKAVSYRTVPDFERGAHVGSGNGSQLSNTSPQPLPSDVAKEVGKPAGTRHVGAF